MLRGSAVSLLLLVAGCDAVFGSAWITAADSPRADDAGDGDGDGDGGTGIAIAKLALARDVAESETVDLIVDVTGPPGEATTYTLAADRGDFELTGMGNVMLDNTGMRRFTGAYHAPQTSGADVITASVGSAVMTLPVTVLDLAAYGNDSTLAGPAQINGNTVVAIAVTIPREGELRGLGIRSVPTTSTQDAYFLRFALYSQDGLSKLAETESALPVTNRTVADVTAKVRLGAGTYWVAVLPDRMATIYADASTGSARTKPAVFSAGMPANLSGASSVSSTFALFLVLAY